MVFYKEVHFKASKFEIFFFKQFITFTEDALSTFWLKLVHSFWRKNCKCKSTLTDRKTDAGQNFGRKTHLSFLSTQAMFKKQIIIWCRQETSTDITSCQASCFLITVLFFTRTFRLTSDAIARMTTFHTTIWSLKANRAIWKIEHI